MKAKQWMVELNKTCQFMSKETPGKKASSSEIQRWIERGSVLFNGERVQFDEEIDFPIISLVLTSKNNTTTIW